MKTSLNKRLAQAGLAALALTAGAGVSYGQLLYDFTSSNGNETHWSSSGNSTTYSFIADPTLPAGLGTDAILWGVQGNNSGSPFSTAANWGVGGFGDINASAYDTLTVWVRPYQPPATFQYFQYILQSSGNGYMISAENGSLPGTPVAGDTVTSLANGWYKVVMTDSGITGGNAAVNWATIYNIEFLAGDYNQYGQNAQGEVGGIMFSSSAAPEPTSLALLGFGAVAFGLTAFRRKSVK